MPSRRRLLVTGAGTAGAMLAGCLSGPSGDSATETDTPPSCSARDPPEPTDAATAPRSYPDRPAELTGDAVERFLTEYERAYQYNDALADDPNKIGRTNEFSVYVGSVTVETDGERFTAEVSGQLQTDIVDVETTPETPTETPLPMGHGPFETSYVVTDRKLRRDGVVVECW